MPKADIKQYIGHAFTKSMVPRTREYHFAGCDIPFLFSLTLVRAHIIYVALCTIEQLSAEMDPNKKNSTGSWRLGKKKNLMCVHNISN